MMTNIEFSAQLNDLDVMRVNKDAFTYALCQTCAFFAGNGGMEGIECNGAYSKSDALMTIPHSTRLAFSTIQKEAKCEP